MTFKIGRSAACYTTGCSAADAMLPAWLQLDPETQHYYRFYTRSPLLLHTQGWYQKWYYWSSSQATCIFHAIRPSLLNLHIRTLTFWHSLVGTPMMISNRCRTLKIKKKGQFVWNQSGQRIFRQNYRPAAPAGSRALAGLVYLSE